MPTSTLLFFGRRNVAPTIFTVVTVDFTVSSVGRDDLIPPQEFAFTAFLRRLGSSRPTFFAVIV